MQQIVTSASEEVAPYTLAIDGMGGDGAPDIVLQGIDIAAERHPTAKILLLGDEAVLSEILLRYPRAARISTIRHASSTISMDMKPTAAIRIKDSSMRMAMQAVTLGEAQGVVSAGNSGAMLALAKIVIKTLPGISRPAMAAISPTERGDVIMLDLGANVNCDWRNLVEFAVMGDAFAKAVLGLSTPSIGLLNVGSEEQKGDERLKIAAEILRESPLAKQFYGFVEGHDITAGTTDIVVTDGFTGNIALKTGEGAIKLAFTLLQKVYTASFLAKLGYFLVRPGLRRMKEWLDPRRYNGAVFVGLNGVVVKSHGGTDGEGFAAAIDVAMDMVTQQINRKISDGLVEIGSLTSRRILAEKSADNLVSS